MTMKLPRLSSCPHCGTALRVQLLAGTDIEVGTGPCTADWCPSRTAREGVESVARAVVLAIFIAILIGVCALGYAVTVGMERDMADACAERGGRWTPVRGYFDMPSGRGVCVER